MDLDFALILVVLSALTGLIWAIDAFFFAKKRRERHAMYAGEGADTAVREPVVVEYSRSFFPVIFIVLLIRSFLGEPFQIPSSSMMPTLLIGDFILVSKFSYGLRLPVLNTKVIDLGEPLRGDVVVFRYPEDPTTDYIKRVIGVPGDVIVYREKRLFINNEEVQVEDLGRYIGTGRGVDMTGSSHRRELLADAPHEILVSPGKYIPTPMTQWVVPEGQYFVLGDNRDNSRDSRFWGFVPEENLVGKAVFVWLNLDWRSGSMDFSRIGTVIK